jgi:hypothetical protein
MCATCVAQGAAYLVPAYAVVRTQAWRRRRRSGDPATEAADTGVAADDVELTEASRT